MLLATSGGVIHPLSRSLLNLPASHKLTVQATLLSTRHTVISRTHAPTSTCCSFCCTLTRPSPHRHLWLGNIPLKPNRTAMEALFSRFGPLESVRVFPGKTFAFVNFVAAGHAIQAKAVLDGQPSPHITGPKPLVIRFQKDTAGVPPAGTVAKVGVDIASARARSEWRQRRLCGAVLCSCAEQWVLRRGRAAARCMG